MNGTINELKQGLLKCANENENRTYFTGQVIVSSICKSAKDTIEELEVQLTKSKKYIRELLDFIKAKENGDGRIPTPYFYEEYEKFLEKIEE
jgi:hypothetical protein